MWRDAGLERDAERLRALLSDPHPLARLVAASRARPRGDARRPRPGRVPGARTRRWTTATASSPRARRALRSSSGRERFSLNVNSTLISFRTTRDRAILRHVGCMDLATPGSVGPHRSRNRGRSPMYQISRSIYREIEAEIVEDRQWGAGPTNHERVLRSCEAAVHRLTTDRHYFAKPSKTLFNDIRAYFPMSAQLHVYRVVDRYLRSPATTSRRARRRCSSSPARSRTAARRRARARRASACRCRTTATARRTSTWPRPRSSRSRPDGRARAAWP